MVHYIYKVKIKYTNSASNRIYVKLQPVGLGTFYGFWIELQPTTFTIFYTKNTNTGSEPSQVHNLGTSEQIAMNLVNGGEFYFNIHFRMYRVPTKNLLVNEGSVLSLDVNLNNTPLFKSYSVHEPSLEFDVSRTMKVELKNVGFSFAVISDFTYGPGYGVYNQTATNPNGNYLGMGSELIINCFGNTLNINKPGKTCNNCPLFNSMPCPFCSNMQCLVCPAGLLIDRMTHSCNNNVGLC